MVQCVASSWIKLMCSASLVFKPQPPPPSSYTMIVEGDDLGAAAAGLHTGERVAVVALVNG